MGFGVTEKTGHDGGRDFRLAGRSRQKIINRALLWLAERVAGTIFRALSMACRVLTISGNTMLSEPSLEEKQ